MLKLFGVWSGNVILFPFFETLLLKAYDAKETAPQKVMDAPEPTVLTVTTTEPEESTQSTRPASLDLASFPSFLLKDQTPFFFPPSNGTKTLENDFG